MAVDSLVSGGCIISGSTVRRSLLFSNVRVNSYSEIEDSVILPNVDIGRHVTLKRVVIDKHCRIPEGLEVGVDPAEDRRRFHVTDQGITLVTPEMLGQHGASAAMNSRWKSRRKPPASTSSCCGTCTSRITATTRPASSRCRGCISTRSRTTPTWPRISSPIPACARS